MMRLDRWFIGPRRAARYAAPDERRCAPLILSVFLALTILLGVGVGQASAQEHRPHRPVETPVTPLTPPHPDSEMLDLGFTPARISPDGTHIAGIDDEGRICIQPLGAPSTPPPTCGPVEGDAEISPASIAWAPDSSAIAFSLDALPTLVGSDIYVMERGGEIAILASDPGITMPRSHGDDGERVTPGSGMPRGDDRMDLFPSWSPDSREIAFARMTIGEGGLELVRIDRDGGPTSVIADLSDAGIAAVVGPTFWLEDGTLILSGSNDVTSLWETRIETGELRAIFPDDDPNLPRAVAADVSADGAWISVYSVTNLARGNAAGYYGLVRRATGEPRIFVSAEPAGNGPIVVPRFSPDGRFMASVTGLRNLTLVIWNVETGAPALMLPLQIGGPRLALFSVGVTWLADGTILAPGRDGRAELVTIDTATLQ